MHAYINVSCGVSSITRPVLVALSMLAPVTLLNLNYANVLQLEMPVFVSSKCGDNASEWLASTLASPSNNNQTSQYSFRLEYISLLLCKTAMDKG